MEIYKSTGNVWLMVLDRNYHLDVWHEFAKREGFSICFHKGYYTHYINLYVDIEHKKYKYMWPGVCLGFPFGGHAVNWDEFLQIYEIFKKYEGKQMLQMD